MKCKYVSLVLLLVSSLAYSQSMLTSGDQNTIPVSKSWLQSTAQRLIELEQKMIALEDLSTSLQQSANEWQTLSESRAAQLVSLNIQLNELRTENDEIESWLQSEKSVTEKLSARLENRDESYERLSQTFTNYQTDRIETEQTLYQKIQTKEIEIWIWRAIAAGGILFGVWQTIR